MSKLEKLRQGWKCHLTHPLNCKECPYWSAHIRCYVNLRTDTFVFISDILEEKMKGMSADEIMARFFD